MSAFQAIVIGVFITLIIVGVGVFALFGGALGGGSTGSVVIWGTVDSGTMGTVLDQLRAGDKSFQDVAYVQKSSATYESDLVSAMAAGTGPDLFLIDQTEVAQFSNKIIPIPYGTVSQATFVNSFIDEGQLFLTGSGALALPLMVDPLVMYTNKDLLSGAGVAQVPQYWNELLTVGPKITKFDATRQVLVSGAALGQWSNINNAKEIMSALFLQAGDPITTRGAGGGLASVFGQRTGDAAAGAAESALRFYTEFANPSKSTYSWNKSLPQSSDFFLAGKVAMYFGFASEYKSLINRNPNLHIGVSVLPQLTGNVQATFGTLTGVAISRTARNANGALTVVQKLTSQAGISTLAGQVPLPPVRRDVVLDTSNSVAASVFVQSALIARGWLDPNSNSTDPLFKGMVESVISGSADPAAAVGDTAAQLQQMLQGASYQQ